MNDELSESKNNDIVSSLAVKCGRQNGDACSTCFSVRYNRACLYQICHNGCPRADGVKNITANCLLHSVEQSPSREANPDLQLIKKFSTFYGIRRFITAFTSARHLSLS